MEAVFQCLEHPGVNALILRKTIPDLKRTVIDKFKSDVPRELYESGSQLWGTYNETDHIVYFAPAYKRNPETGKEDRLQSKLYFSACEKETDVSKFLSTEYVFIGFEELGEFSFAIWDALVGRNRCTIPGTRPCMAAATNPMGIGWSWIKRLWIDGKPAEGMLAEKYNPKDYAYFHSTVDQNPLLSKDAEYLAALEASPNRERIRWGKLDVKAGNYFDNFEDLRHVRPASDFIFQHWQPVWVGWDYGFGHWACIVFFTKAILKPRFDGEKPRLVNVAIAELTLRENTIEEQAGAIIQAIPRTVDEAGFESGYKWNLESLFLSHERFNRSTKDKSGNVISMADQAGDVLAAAGLPRPSKANTDRVSGWTKIYSLLDADEFFILQGKCPTLEEAIPALVRGDGITTDIEDVIKPAGVNLFDDIGDACRYGIAGALIQENEEPEEDKLHKKLESIQDPVARQAALYRAWAEHNRPKTGHVSPNVPAWFAKLQAQKRSQ